MTPCAAKNAPLTRKASRLLPMVRARILRGDPLSNRNKAVANCLMLLLGDSDFGVRAIAAEYLASSKVERTLVRREIERALSYERNSLAKVSFIESLGALGERESCPILRKMLEEKKRLVSCYAADSLAAIGACDSVPAIRERLARSTDAHSRAFYLNALHLLCALDATGDLLAILDSRSYIARHVAVSFLAHLANKQSARKIMNGFQEALTRERVRSVRDVILKSLLLLQREFPDCRLQSAPQR